MATVVRGPTYGPAKQFSWPNRDTSLGTPLTLRSAGVMPTIPPPHLVPVNFCWIPFDTSHGTRLTLRSSGVMPTIPPPHLVPVNFRWIPADTSEGIPKPLTPDQTRPFFILQQSLVEALRLRTDTTLGTFPGLFPVVIPQQAPWLATPQLRWQPADTSFGIPKTLFADQTAPFVIQQQILVPVLPNVTDTSRGTFVGLFPVSIPQQMAWVALPRSSWQPADTSFGTAKVLTPDQTLPFTGLQQPLLDPAHPVTDQTRGTFPGLFPVSIPLPIVFLAPARSSWQPADTSSSTAKVLYGDQIPPVVNLPYPTPDPHWSVIDTTLLMAYPNFYPFVPPVPPTTANYHSWHVKAIGVKTKITLPSQVDSETGDVP